MPRLVAALLLFAVSARAQPWISEVLLNPPGSDAPNQYIELRGTPNFVMPNGTYFVAVEGDMNGNPGTIQDVFDLSGLALGGNGFLVLLENSNSYAFNLNAAVIVNTNGTGFGSGVASTTRHRGEGGQTDVEHASVTFFLLESTNFPSIGSDIDANDDGIPDGALYQSWTIFDSVALLDNDGQGDIGYGQINFRRNSATLVTAGTIVPVNFTAAYVARTGNTTDWAASSWVASGTLTGSAPNWVLGASDTEPAAYGGRPLNHIGGPNFGALDEPGVAVRESGGSTDLLEGSGTDSYVLLLNAPPLGDVTIQITAGPQLQISTDGGLSFGTARTVVFTSTTTMTNVVVRALDDHLIDASPHVSPVAHAIISTADAVRYPTTALMPRVNVKITDNDTALLNELKVNPPGPVDTPFEFIELIGSPGATLTNIYLLVIEGNEELNPGTVNVAMNLTSQQIGSNGVLLIVADGHPYSVPPGAGVYLAPQLDIPPGGLGNGSISFLLVGSASPIVEGADLDAGDNGVLEGLPNGATILDSVAWLDGSGHDAIYSPAALTQAAGTPDAATRIPGNTNANSAAAWVNGNLEGTNGDSLIYAASGGSPNLAYGTVLTPGFVNNTAPAITGLTPFSAVIGDPTTPLLTFQITDDQTPVDQLVVNVSSSDESIVPDSNLVLGGSGSVRTLSISPVGVGYASLTVTVSDGNMIGRAIIPFAASADARGGGRFHTGASDGSTALAVDNEFMLVGDDENQVLRLYSRSNSGPAVAEFNMNPFLGLLDLYDNGTPREVDIEASTRVGDRLYWLGSHSHSRDAEVRTNRGRIFVTDRSGSGRDSVLTFVGRYDFLKLDLMNWDATNGHGKGSNYFGLMASGAPGVDPKAPDGSGFNFEGLAMAPGSTNTAFVCFRAPLVPATNRAKALIVPVTNFAALAISSATNAGAARFGTPIELNLGGRGIRSIEGDTNGYLISAGTPAAVPGDLPPQNFRLFTWNGFATNAPQEHDAILTDMIPEGIVELPPAPWTSNSQVQLISDNGITDFYNDGMEAKLLPIREFKKFRSDWVALGAVVIPPPVIKVVRCDGNDCVITWYSVEGLTYRVQFKSALSDADWTDIAGDETAMDALTSKTISVTGVAQRFFRVIRL